MKISILNKFAKENLTAKEMWKSKSWLFVLFFFLKTYSNIILHGETLNNFLWSSETKKMSTISHLLNIILQVLAHAIVQEKEIRGVKTEKICR